MVWMTQITSLLSRVYAPAGLDVFYPFTHGDTNLSNYRITVQFHLYQVDYFPAPNHYEGLLLMRVHVSASDH